MLAFAKTISGSQLPTVILIALCFSTMMLGYISWKYVENPFRNKLAISRIKVFSFSIIFTLAFVTVGFIGYKNDGFENRFPILKNINSKGSEILMNGDNCFLLNTDVKTFDINKCTSNSMNKRFNVLLLGDSHSASLYGGLKNYLENNDITLSMLSSAYCLPLVEYFPNKNTFTATERCEQINRKINDVINNNNFDLILVSSYILEWGFRNNPKISYNSYYEDYLSKIKSINSHSKVVVIGEFVVWTDGLPNEISREIFSNQIYNIYDLPKYSMRGVDKQLFSAENILANDFGKINIPYISVVDALCNKDGCLRYTDTTNGEKLIAIDYGHLSIDGSEYISNNIVGPKVVSILKKSIK